MKVWIRDGDDVIDRSEVSRAIETDGNVEIEYYGLRELGPNGESMETFEDASIWKVDHIDDSDREVAG